MPTAQSDVTLPRKASRGSNTIPGERVTLKPTITAMMGSKVIIAAITVSTLYFGLRDPSWYQASALLLLIGGGYLLSMHSYRLELEDGAVQLRSVYGRSRIKLSDIKEVSISHLASSAPFALTFHQRRGPPITWKVILFGRGSDAFLAALRQSVPITDTGYTGWRHL